MKYMKPHTILLFFLIETVVVKTASSFTIPTTATRVQRNESSKSPSLSEDRALQTSFPSFTVIKRKNPRHTTKCNQSRPDHDSTTTPSSPSSNTNGKKRGLSASSQSTDTYSTSWPISTRSSSSSSTIYPQFTKLLKNTDEVFSSTITSSPSTGNESEESSSLNQSILQVLSASLLVTTNTIGGGMMVIPSTTQGPGLLCSTGLILTVYVINLISGFLIAEVAINQYTSASTSTTTTPKDVPSSFKEFSEANLNSPMIATFISILFIFANWCVLSFNLIRAGEIVSSNAMFRNLSETIMGSINGILPLDIMGGGDDSTIMISTAACMAAILWATLVGTLTNKALSGIASICCFALFTSFAGLVLPGLTHLQADPMSIWMEPGTSYPIGSPTFLHSVATALPIFATTTCYQNIVPSLSKLLMYDRVKIMTAMTLGSFIPISLYLIFCFVVAGGGMNMDLSTAGPLFTLFSTACVVGTSMACTMSISEEFDSFFVSSSSSTTMLKSNNVDDEIREDEVLAKDTMSQEPRNIASLPSVTMAVIPPLIAGILFSGGEEFVAALGAAGGIGSPLLYGVIPVMLAYNQRYGGVQQGDAENDSISIGMNSDDNETRVKLVPGGLVPLGILSAVSLALIWSSISPEV